MERMKVLFLGAHTDDIELACGGTMAKLVDEGYEVSCIAFSNCNDPQLTKEFNESMKLMNVKYHYVSTYPIRIMNTYRQQILDYMIDLRACDFDLVFTHSLKDCHQDHKVIAEETFRAFKHTTIYTYAHPWNTVDQSFGCLSVFKKKHLNKKIEAISLYTSQKNRTYTQPEYIRSVAISNGLVADARYAEVFECMRVII
jgi:LmbE family N-acetylglucosaminyl deacetylase